MTTALFICRASKDIWAAVKLECTSYINLDSYMGIVGETPLFEMEGALYPYPCWPNLLPLKRCHAL
jgi:hypothetical protein